MTYPKMLGPDTFMLDATSGSPLHERLGAAPSCS